MKKYMKLLIIILILIISIIYYLYAYVLHPCIIRNILRKMAKDIIPILNKYSIDYWVDFGTLLGIIREKDIILNDDDIDITLIDTPELYNKMTLAKEDIIKLGYSFKRMDWSAYRIYKDKKIFADLYLNKKDDTNKQYIGAEGEKSNIAYSTIGTPKIIKWNNIDVRVPENIEQTLIYRFGEDYMTPRRGYKGRLT
jgi:phosphorylcholine metabolism protein LicD